MILQDVQAKLEQIDPEVHYGSAAKFDREKAWDYTVFSRRVMNSNKSKTGYADVFEVCLVREMFIPDGLAEQVIDALTGDGGIPGMRVSDSEFKYDYAVKPDTADTVEMLVLEFVKPRKRNV
jgi:hypothetical protein